MTIDSPLMRAAIRKHGAMLILILAHEIGHKLGALARGATQARIDMTPTAESRARCWHNLPDDADVLDRVVVKMAGRRAEELMRQWFPELDVQLDSEIDDAAHGDECGIDRLLDDVRDLRKRCEVRNQSLALCNDILKPVRLCAEILNELELAQPKREATTTYQPRSSTYARLIAVRRGGVNGYLTPDEFQKEAAARGIRIPDSVIDGRVERRVTRGGVVVV